MGELLIFHFPVTHVKMINKKNPLNNTVALIDCTVIALDCGGSYIDSPKWLKSKKAIINP